MRRAAVLRKQANREFEKKRRGLMHQQTRTARHNRVVSIPFAVIGVLFSATAGGLFWHVVLSSLDLWLNLTVGTMFALAVSVTFVQGELLKRIKDEAISEALRSGEMQATMLKQQSEEMVLEMVVDSMVTVREDPSTLQEMGQTIKGELKIAIQTLTAQTTSRLVEDAGSHPVIIVDSEAQSVPQIEEKADSKRQRKEPEWLSNPALPMVLKMYPRLRQKLDSLRLSGRVTISMLSLMDALNCSKKYLQYRMKTGVLQVATHNSNLVRIDSVLDWLSALDLPEVKEVPVAQNDPVTEAIPVTTDSEVSSLDPEQADTLPSSDDSDWDEKVSAALEVLRANPDITDEELAVALNLNTLELAQFWKVNAGLLLQRGEPSLAGKSNGHVDYGKEVDLTGFPAILV